MIIHLVLPPLPAGLLDLEFKILSQAVLNIRAGLTFENYFVFSHSIFKYFVCISEQIASFVLYNINWFIFTVEKESVYCEVRTWSLRKIDNVSSLNFKHVITSCIHIMKGQR
jgi:hypothetical protein